MKAATCDCGHDVIHHLGGVGVCVASPVNCFCPYFTAFWAIKKEKPAVPTTLNIEDLKTGSHVQVTLRGEITDIDLDDPTWITVEQPDGNYVELATEGEGVSIEVVSPPIVTFTANQRVRAKARPHYEYTIGHEGYFDHTTGRVHHNQVDGPVPPFTSLEFELVSAR